MAEGWGAGGGFPNEDGKGRLCPRVSVHMPAKPGKEQQDQEGNWSAWGGGMGSHSQEAAAKGFTPLSAGTFSCAYCLCQTETLWGLTASWRYLQPELGAAAIKGLAPNGFSPPPPIKDSVGLRVQVNDVTQNRACLKKFTQKCNVTHKYLTAPFRKGLHLHRSIPSHIRKYRHALYA